MERHEWEDKEETHRQLQHEVDNLKRKHQLIIDENNLLSIKVYQHYLFFQGYFYVISLDFLNRDNLKVFSQGMVTGNEVFMHILCKCDILWMLFPKTKDFVHLVILCHQVQNLEKERLEYEQNLSKLKRLSDQQRQDVVDLQGQLSEMESLKIQLQQ